MKLNIGGGAVELEGFENVDRKNGREAYPLDFPSDSVEEIRASHILEHFSHLEVDRVLADWVRVLKPGGLIKLAVPDFDALVKDHYEDPFFESYLFGGQTDENDYHKSVFTEAKLKALMTQAGLSNLEQWESDATDCSAHKFSLNLQGEKTGAPKVSLNQKVRAVMTMPRCGPLASRNIMESALHAHQIPITTSQGAFWDQCLQRMFESCVADGIDWILTLDFDTVPTAGMVQGMIDRFAKYPDIDALAPLQVRRNGDSPLMTAGGSEEVAVDGSPILVTTAHFGMTLLRVEKLKGMPKPWFVNVPDENGEYTDNGKQDADIYFWNRWRECGNNIFVDPTVRIGHLEETVSYFDERMRIQRCSVPEWRDRFLK